ncbi:hypothetical protein HK097_001630 [Rhizophlyctis rosea]|uniref:Erythromycin esterase n=1 Tax=Rhizophlyctis rosea TaxID=64517 RepID=A0AAD5SG12_9FUNG|nr:hypothetical protein HK097_001630 [Rhizophlyctis rosea]
MPAPLGNNPISANAIPVFLNDPKRSYDRLLSAIGDSQFVLIGDGTHGTAEFYKERAYITQRLVQEKGFTVVGVEGDWPDCYRINQYVKGYGKDSSAIETLRDFKRFPLWMWRNDVMVPFIAWMRSYNDAVKRDGRPQQEKVTFHGIDMYSLHKSAETVVQYLEKIDPALAKKAKERYACFDKFGPDTMTYALFTGRGVQKSCQKEVQKVLTDLLNDGYAKVAKGLSDDEDGPQERKWVAMMNALVVSDAEKYYRCMLEEDEKTWNIRDTHMVQVLDELVKHHQSPTGGPAKAIVWAHNSHLGDASATDMGKRRGEINVGQLCREKWGTDKVFNIGFLSNTGTVTAADEWDEPAQNMTLNPSMRDSVEDILYDACGRNMENFMLIMKTKETDGGRKKDVDPAVTRLLSKPLLQRYVGVLYKPATERWSHYSKSELANQRDISNKLMTLCTKTNKKFDACVYLHSTTGITPLDATNHFPDADENVPDTYPFAL